MKNKPITPNIREWQKGLEKLVEDYEKFASFHLDAALYGSIHDYTQSLLLNLLDEVEKEVVGGDEWEDPDITGCDQGNGDMVIKPWRRNGLRKEQRQALSSLREVISKKSEL